MNFQTWDMKEPQVAGQMLPKVEPLQSSYFRPFCLWCVKEEEQEELPQPVCGDLL